MSAAKVCITWFPFFDNDNLCSRPRTIIAKHVPLSPFLFSHHGEVLLERHPVIMQIRLTATLPASFTRESLKSKQWNSENEVLLCL